MTSPRLLRPARSATRCQAHNTISACVLLTLATGLSSVLLSVNSESVLTRDPMSLFRAVQAYQMPSSSAQVFIALGRRETGLLLCSHYILNGLINPAGARALCPHSSALRVLRVASDGAV